MLCDDMVNDAHLADVYPGFAKIQEELVGASKYVLAPDFTCAADGLMDNKEQLDRMVPFCRLPSRICWRAFDCRAYFLGMARNDRRVYEREARKAGGPAKAEIFKAGRERLGTLTEQQRTAALQRRTDRAGVYLGNEKVL